MKQVIQNIFVILNSREKQKLWLLALADIIISVLDIIFLIALLYVLHFYTQPIQTGVSKNVSLSIFNAHPVLLIIVFFLLFAVKNTGGFFISTMQFRFVYAVASRISRKNITQYLNNTYQDYVHIDSSVINRKVGQEPIEFAHYVLNGVQQVFSQAVLVLIALAAVIIFNPLLFPLLVLILAPPVLLISFLVKHKLDSARLHGKKTGEQTIQYLQEALSGFVESNLYQKNEFFINRYHRLQVLLNHYLSERLIVQNIPPRLIEVFAVFGLLALVMINFFTAHNNSIPLVTIGALAAAAYKIIPGIVKITNTTGQVKTYAFAAADLAVAEPPLKHYRRYEPIKTLSFENVFFGYPGKQLLSSFSLSLQPGDFAVLSCISGKGKTTFINLLLGFLTPASGNICINGRIADTENRQGNWGAIAYVKQQSFFLHASIIENITLQEGEYDEERIKRITAITGIDKMAGFLPLGLETIITENGKNFSGGQRQRIIFARALYKAFDLLILDEPFSELDEPSEKGMLCELQKMAVGEKKIIILVTHNKMAMAFGNKKISMDE